MPSSLAAGEKPEVPAGFGAPLGMNITLSDDKPASLVTPFRTLSLRTCFERAFANNQRDIVGKIYFAYCRSRYSHRWRCAESSL